MTLLRGVAMLLLMLAVQGLFWADQRWPQTSVKFPNTLH